MNTLQLILVSIAIGIVLANAFKSAGHFVWVSIGICFVCITVGLGFGYYKLPVYLLFGIAGLAFGFKIRFLGFKRAISDVVENPKKLFG